MAEALLDLAELRGAFRELLSAESDPRSALAAFDRGEVLDRALWTKMAELGWLGLAVPEAHGGLGLGLAEAAVLAEELGRSLSRVPATGALLAAQAIEAAGSDALKTQWLPKIASGEAVATLVPSQAGVPALRLAPDERINGVVADAPWSDVADLLLLPVSDAGGPVGLVLLTPDEAGVQTTPRPAIDLTRTLGRVDVLGLQAGADQLLRLSPAQLAELEDQAAILLACDSIGGAAAILERTVEYMKTRVQFGRPIGSFQALKHRAAHWKVLLDAASALTRHAAAQLAAGAPEASAAAASAKFYACDAYAAIAGDAVQLHGGIGFTWEHECHLFLKRAKLNQALFGDSAACKDRAARLLFATPA